MKKIILKLLIFGFLLVFFHAYIYIGVQSENYTHNLGGTSFRDFFTVSAPVDYAKLEVVEELYPTYSNPFRSTEYRYTEKGNNEVVLITRKQVDYLRDVMWNVCAFFYNGPPVAKCIHHFGLSRSDYWPQVISGDEMRYYDPETDCCFKSGGPFGGKHANRLFFLVQYTLLIAFIYQLIKAILIYRNRK